MRIRFIILFILTMLILLIGFILTFHSGIRNAREDTLAEIHDLMEPYVETGSQLEKELAIYQAFSGKWSIERTRETLKIFIIMLLIMSLLFFIIIFGITRPLKNLTFAVKQSNPSNLGDHSSIPEQGTYETRTLIRSFNLMMEQIRQYETLIGDSARYRGWKDISKVIVHEVNNLISPVETYTGFLLEKLEGKDQQKAEFILNKLGEIRGVLSRLRELSHLPEAKPERVDMIQLLNGISAEFGNVTFNYAEVQIELETDPVLFNEMVRNLIINGLESSDNSEVKVHLTEEKHFVQVEVEDEGIGIPQEITDKLFQPGISTKPGNLGIGLSITKSIAAELNIGFDFYSTYGKGTVFILKLPKD